MDLLNKITNLLYRKQRILEIIAIFLFFCLVAFRFNRSNIKLLWSDYPFIAFAIALAIAIIAIIWLRIEKQKTQLLINNIQKNREEKINLREADFLN